MTYRVAIMGAGTMGGYHAKQWAKIDQAELVGVLDSRPARGARIGVPAYTDWSAMLSEAKPDIIDICVPTPYHREYVEKAASAGKAILVEKPLARSIEDCDAIIDAVEKAGVPAMSANVLRYFPEYAAAKRLVDEGAVGTPVTIRTARMAGFPDTGYEDNWYADSSRSGGLVLDLILHDFDWMLWTFGPVSRVYAQGLIGSPLFASPLDYALVTLRFASGAVGHVTGSWSHPGGFRTTLEIAGDGGIIEHDSAKTAPLHTALRQKGAGSGGIAVPESPMYPSDDPYFQEIAAFVNALETGAVPPITLQEARESARLALAAIESIETGKVVTLA